MRDTSLLLLLLLSFTIKSQENLEGLSAGKMKSFAEAAAKNRDFETANIYLESYLEKNPEDLNQRYQLADNYRLLGAYEEALGNYRLVLASKKAKRYPLCGFYIAEMLVASGDCKAAIPLYEQFRKDYKGEKEERKYRNLAKAGVEGCEKQLRDTSSSKQEFIIKALNAPINTNHIEGSPVHLKDDQWIYNSLRSEQTIYGSDEAIPQRYFYQMNFKGEAFEEQGKWKALEYFDQAEVANGAFNKDHSRFYFSACEVNGLGKISCDLYKMEQNAQGWSKPMKLPGTVNSKYTESQVAVGIDEKGRETIYFASNRKDGKGGLDIWYSTYNAEKQSYKQAKNCGSKINSEGNEMTPFIHPLNNKLFFSSDGHPGYGQLDLFSSAGQRSKWQDPVNLGKWINSSADELYYAAHPNGTEGLFASNRKKKPQDKFCCDDLYYFKELNKILVKLDGKVSGENEPLIGAQMSVYQLDENGEKLFLQSSVSTDPYGNYKLVLEPNQSYYIQAKKDGYLVEEKVLKTKNSLKSESYTLDFDLSVKSDRVFILENIYYAFDKDIVTKESEITIDTTIYEILILNPELIVEIGSHTDNKGSAGYNMKLSQRRAESVIRYLRKKGIAAERIIAKGYGEEVPIAPNQNEDGSDNPEGRAKNRRTEFRVIGEIKLKEKEDD